MEKRIPIIIDCDPGHDDVGAIMMAIASEKFDLKGITCVPGNGLLDYLPDNMLKVLDRLHLGDIPVVRGIAKPFRGDCRPARSVHGFTGLDGPLFPPTKRKPLNENVCDFIYRTVMAEEEPFTLIALGPLTNVAATLLTHPDLKAKIGRIALMGGSAAAGNVNPTAEFNFWHDPDAARIVFQSGIRIMMCGLDVTWKAVLTFDEVDELAALGTNGGDLMAEMFDYYKMYRKMDGISTVLPHDSTPVAWLIDKSIIKTRPCYVEVDVFGENTRGCSVTHACGPDSGRTPNADVAYDCDREKFKKLVFDTARYFK